jgi:hypothetical protein
LHVYTWLWLLGDVRMLRAARHTLGPSELKLELGARASASVPYDAIAGVELGGARPGDARFTPLDSPNCRLTLTREVAVLRMLRGERPVSAIALYVDEPARLKAALDARLATARQYPGS